MKVLSLMAVMILSGQIFASTIKTENMSISCGSLIQQRVNYCIYRTNGSQNPDVLYHLHGLTLDEFSWVTIPLYKFIRREWRNQNFDAPTVITFSYGESWLLTPRGESEMSGLYEEVMEIVIPQLESIHARPIRDRMLMGMSMGGFNGAQIYLRNPKMFKRTALLCPAMATVSPYSSKAEVDDYIDRTGADPTHVKLAIKLGGDYFSKKDWSKESPLVKAERTMSRGANPLYIFAGQTDSFGFFEGDLAFYHQALASGLPVSWDENEYGHCFFDGYKVADFFAH